MKLALNILFLVFVCSNIIGNIQDTISPPPSVCSGEKGLIYGVEGQYESSTFFWAIFGGDIINDSNDLDNSIIVNWKETSEDISYSLTVYELTENNCQSEPVQVDIGFKPLSKINMPQNASICPDSIIELDAGPGFINYEWGSTNGDDGGASTFLATKTGNYWVHAVNKENCQSSDTINLVVVPVQDAFLSMVTKDSLVKLENTKQLCNETAEIKVNFFFDYLWSTGSIEQSIQFSEVRYDSLIWVKVKDFFGCDYSDSVLITKCLKAIYTPTAFTPNGDGYNDTWVLEGLENFADAEISVFNREKTLVFYSRGNYTEWDGTADNGKLLPVDSYHYYINLNEEGYDDQTGFITIIY